MHRIHPVVVVEDTARGRWYFDPTDLRQAREITYPDCRWDGGRLVIHSQSNCDPFSNEEGAKMSDGRLKISLTGAISSDRDLAELLSGANQMLGEVIGPSGSSVNADWSLGTDEKGRRRVVLILRDHTGSVEIRFAPDDLKNPRDRLHRAWGELLAQSSM